MDIKFYMVFISALIPLVVGFIWYNPKVLGTAWMNASGMTEEKAKGANMGLVFGLTYLFSVMISIVMLMLVIHQIHVGSVLANDPGFNDPNSDVGRFLADFNAKYGSNFRTFKHGAFHGVFTGILFALPLMAINALFERKGWKYILINAGYWIICLGLMGGVICQFA